MKDMASGHLARLLLCLGLPSFSTLSVGAILRGGANVQSLSLNTSSHSELHNALSATSGKCLHAANWYKAFVPPVSNRLGYSQGNEDAIGMSLFDAKNLGTVSKFGVEFGFNTPDLRANSNVGALVERLGFKHLLLDGGWENPALHLHKRMITKENIVNIFDEFKVPLEPDYVSIDVDSCDLWLFLALTRKYKPRVLTVEYNSNYPLGEYTTQKCRSSTPWVEYAWGGDNIYGASLSALALAAKHRGYAIVQVLPPLDVTMVRQDLLCPGSELPIETFASATNIPNGAPYQQRIQAGQQIPPAAELLEDFQVFLKEHPDA